MKNVLWMIKELVVEMIQRLKGFFLKRGDKFEAHIPLIWQAFAEYSANVSYWTDAFA